MSQGPIVAYSLHLFENTTSFITLRILLARRYLLKSSVISEKVAISLAMHLKY